GLRRRSSKSIGPPRDNGSCSGEISSPERRNAPAYSKRIRPESSSASAPTVSPQRRTSARQRISAIAPATPQLPIAHQPHRTHRNRRDELLEHIETPIPAQQSDDGGQRGIVAILRPTHRGPRQPSPSCRLLL